MEEGEKNTAKAVLKRALRAPKLAAISLKDFFDDRAERAKAIATSKHMDVETKLKLLTSLHRQMNLLSSFLLSMVLAVLGGILFWAISQDLTAALLGWAILMVILFETIVTAQDRAFKRALSS